MDVKTDIDEEEYDTDLDSEEAAEKAEKLEKDIVGDSDGGGERNLGKDGKDELCSDEDMEYDFCGSGGKGADF